MTTALIGSFYTAARGGHAPGDLRDAFDNALEALSIWEDGPEPTVGFREEDLPISKIFGMLWNCDDILPSILWTHLQEFDEHGEIKSRTYGAASRFLKTYVAEAV